ncbi:hypothetical protein E2C01_041073 [Portunus trituberculatus]|uniref:Uncharacterized protein n=1 Tax=Portunus trituberculatus TaxID=210409 RepID=A0A5B7FJ23_PORTR|nr:hypothetical protein [Portunus trituberculatus]
MKRVQCFFSQLEVFQGREVHRWLAADLVLIRLKEDAAATPPSPHAIPPTTANLVPTHACRRGGMRQGKVDSTREEAFHLVDGALSRQVHAEERGGCCQMLWRCCDDNSCYVLPSLLSLLV